jgi:probable O-glycosylation ligase (exosortase A-associated)
VVDLFLAAFVMGLLALGLRRPFIWVLAYLYIDIVAPQKISYFILTSLPISLIAFCAAFGGWMIADDKRDARFTWRQGLMLVLLLYCGATTMSADFPVEAADKWAWVWKALVFAIFLPMVLRTRLRIEAVVLTMVLSAGSIIISGGIKSLAGGGGYGTLKLFVNDNTGLYEGSILSTVAIAIVPLIWWLARFGTIYRPEWKVRMFALALTFACLMIPIGTQARTGLLCIALLGAMSLRSAKRKFLYAALAGLAVLAVIPFLPASYTKRMDTIENHQSDESASTRVAVWEWTLDYVQDHPFGGGFDAFRGNRIKVETRHSSGTANNIDVEVVETLDQARAYHSSYFEMLGEQGWPGLILWLTLQIGGIWQMENLRARWKKRTGPGETWQAPLANALQQSHMIYLVGGLFVGIAYQPFILMLIGVQCGLWTYLRRIDRPHVRQAKQAIRPLSLHQNARHSAKP